MATTVGIVSPGAMGSGFARALSGAGVRVVATVEGRSARTIGLAEESGAELLADLASVVEAADQLWSIAPPGQAPAIAQDLARLARERGVTPLVADLNAVSPATVGRVAATLAEAGLDLVDGSISGPPPRAGRSTRLYLSGPRSDEVARLAPAGVDIRVVGDAVGTASAVKMSTASVYKGTAAVVTQALRTAQANGVVDEVLADLRAAMPELLDGVERWIADSASKSARFVGEMHEIAQTQADAALTPALFEAMADVYAAIAETTAGKTSPEDARRLMSLDDVLDALRD